MPGVELDPISFRGPDPAKRFKDILIEQKLGAQIPLALPFKDEQGTEVTLSQYFGKKPVLLALVYYGCPSVCTQVLNSLTAVIDAQANTLDIGKDYDVITVSIDPRETPALAAEKKHNYIAQLHRSGGNQGWHFLTGGQEAIETLAQSVGFRYYYDTETDQYAHAGGIMVATPFGKIHSYALGVEYLPGNVAAALRDAGAGNIGRLVNNIVALCYMYDPTKGAYGLYIMGTLRLAGALTVAAIGAFWLITHLRGRARAATPASTDLGGMAQEH
jgi:protein SCO1/2